LFGIIGLFFIHVCFHGANFGILASLNDLLNMILNLFNVVFSETLGHFFERGLVSCIIINKLPLNIIFGLAVTDLEIVDLEWIIGDFVLLEHLV
jgi:hypothetical protein